MEPPAPQLMMYHHHPHLAANFLNQPPQSSNVIISNQVQQLQPGFQPLYPPQPQSSQGQGQETRLATPQASITPTSGSSSSTVTSAFQPARGQGQGQMVPRPPQGPHQPLLNHYYGPFGGFHSQFAQIFIHTNGPHGPQPLPPRHLNLNNNNENRAKRESNLNLQHERRVILELPNQSNSLALPTPARPPVTISRKPRTLTEALAAEHKRTSAEGRKAVRLHYCGQEGCDYKTDRKNNLCRHLQTMHGDLAPGQELPCCGLKFRTKTAYRAHVREAHRHGYACSWANCDKVFPRKALLMRHNKVHTGERTFFCDTPGCPYTTNHKSNLERHRTTHEKNDRLIEALKMRDRAYGLGVETTQSLQLRRRIFTREQAHMRHNRNGALGEVFLKHRKVNLNRPELLGYPGFNIPMAAVGGPQVEVRYNFPLGEEEEVVGSNPVHDVSRVDPDEPQPQPEGEIEQELAELSAISPGSEAVYNREGAMASSPLEGVSDVSPAIDLTLGAQESLLTTPSVGNASLPGSL